MPARSVSNVLLRVNGAPVPPEVSLGLMSVTVNDDLGMASTFSLQLHSWDDDLHHVTWMDSPFFALGSTVEILLGYVDGPIGSVIAGEISDLEADFSLERPPTLTVTGYDFRARLGRNSSDTTYPNHTDSEIATEIIVRNKLVPDVTPTSYRYEWLSQDNSTDLAFLMDRAKINGFEVLVQGERVRFGPPMPATVPLIFGDELIAFSPSVAGSDLVGSVEISGTDLTQSGDQDYTVTEFVKKFGGILPEFDSFTARVDRYRGGPPTRDEADVLARNRVAELEAQSVSGSGRCRGNPLLRAGTIAVIGNVGRRFTGTYRVTSVTHSFTPDDGYSTSFRVSGSPTTT